jgi:hypothetical protein
MNVKLPPNNKIALSKIPKEAAILHNRKEPKMIKKVASRQSKRNKF